MSKPTISTATLEEVQDAFKRAREASKNASCLLCKIVFTKKHSTQLFCCVEHRKAFWRIKKSIEAGKLRK